MMEFENDLITPVGLRSKRQPVERIQPQPQPQIVDPFANDPFDDDEDDAEPLWGRKPVPQTFEAFLAELQSQPVSNAFLVPPRFAKAMQAELRRRRASKRRRSA